MPCPKCVRDFSEEPWFKPVVTATLILFIIFLVSMTKELVRMLMAQKY